MAYVDRVARYNNRAKISIVAVDVLSRYLRILPMRTKLSQEKVKAFKRKVRKKTLKMLVRKKDRV